MSKIILSIFVGYYVVWSVTPSLHTPLMSVTNAISSVIIVGAIIAALAGSTENIFETSNTGFLAIILAAVNIFGGFLVTQRMLQMYKKRSNKHVGKSFSIILFSFWNTIYFVSLEAYLLQKHQDKVIILVSLV